MSKIFVLSALVVISSIVDYSTAVTLREGDIVMEALPKSLGENEAYKKWPNGVIPYEISSYYTSAQKNLILSGMEMIRSKTEGCISFVPRSSSHKNWISIKSLGGCFSNVGKSYYPGGQDLSLGNGCLFKGTIVHELCHAIGFWHEQNRPDRDSYVKINYGNINQGLWSNFDKYNKDYFKTPYDFKSIMHYDEYAFSNNRQKTIVPLQSGIDIIPAYSMTDSQILSNYDIQAIKTSYQCKAGSLVTTTKPSVTTTTTDFTFKIYNDRLSTFELYWWDVSNDKLHKYNTVKSGQTITQKASVGHEWVLYTTDSKWYAYFKIGSGKFTKSGATHKTSSLDWTYIG